MCIEFQHLSCQVVVIKGLAYLLTYFIAVVIAAVAWNWINFGIHLKNLLLHSRPWPWVCGLACLWPWQHPWFFAQFYVVIIAELFSCYHVQQVSAISDQPARRCIAANVLQTKLDAQCHKLATELS